MTRYVHQPGRGWVSLWRKWRRPQHPATLVVFDLVALPADARISGATLSLWRKARR